jgi:proteasome accessory factor C
VQHPGAEIVELTRLFDVPENELLADLNLLFVSGLPPYGPGDLIDVLIEDGKVWISMADYLSRPLRLTRDEAVALYLRGKALLALPGLPEAPALSSALAKLEAGIGKEPLGELAGRVEYSAESAAGVVVEQARAAATTSERIEIDYYSASRDETTTRRIDPEEVFAAAGHWYVVAWDRGAEDERIFRADRIRRVEATGEHFERRGLPGAGRPLYEAAPEDVNVRLLLDPGARWVAEYYVTSSILERDGGLEVTIPARNLAWVTKLLVRLGGEGHILAPLPDLAVRVRTLAEHTLSMYA